MKNRVWESIRRWIPFGAVPEISPENLSAVLLSADSSIQLLDVRMQSEWTRHHIEGAINVPILHLSSSLERIPFQKTLPIVAICLSGHRSIPAVRVLQKAGFEQVCQLEGGMKAWNKLYPEHIKNRDGGCVGDQRS